MLLSGLWQKCLPSGSRRNHHTPYNLLLRVHVCVVTLQRINKERLKVKKEAAGGARGQAFLPGALDQPCQFVPETFDDDVASREERPILRKSLDREKRSKENPPETRVKILQCRPESIIPTSTRERNRGTAASGKGGDGAAGMASSGREERKSRAVTIECPKRRRRERRMEKRERRRGVGDGDGERDKGFHYFYWRRGGAGGRDCLRAWVPGPCLLEKYSPFVVMKCFHYDVGTAIRQSAVSSKLNFTSISLLCRLCHFHGHFSCFSRFCRLFG